MLELNEKYSEIFLIVRQVLRCYAFLVVDASSPAAIKGSTFQLGIRHAFLT